VRFEAEEKESGF